MTNESDRSMKGGGWSDSSVRPLVETVWDYHHVNHELAPADAILVLCSHDTVVAERGAELLLEGWAPLLIFSGGLGTITRHLWQEPEADQFAAHRGRHGRARRSDPDREPIDQHRRERPVHQDGCSPSGRSIPSVHRGAEAVHGTPQLCDVPEGLAGETGDRDVAAGVDGRYLDECSHARCRPTTW